MEGEKTVAPINCANKCGFFGNPQLKNLCSKCHRMVQEEKKEKEKSINKSNSKEEPVSTPNSKLENITKVSSELSPPTLSPSQNQEINSNGRRYLGISPASSTLSSNLSMLTREQTMYPYLMIGSNSSSYSSSSSSSSSPEQELKSDQISITPSLSDEEKEKNKIVQTDFTRCFTCNKKVGLTMIKCRCGLGFCGKHRYPESHACDFDFKALGKKQIMELNPLIASNKGHNKL